MADVYLDTNVFIRFLTNDHEIQSPRAYTLFKEVEQGKRTVTTVGVVIAEIVYILSSRNLYHLSRQAIRDTLGDVLSLKGLKLDDKGSYRRALELYATSRLDFPDAYLIAVAERKNALIMSFDQGIDKLRTVSRIEP